MSVEAPELSHPSEGPNSSTGRLTAVGHVLGWIAVATILGSVIASLVPINNPGVQECGVPAAYLLQGRVNVYPDENSQVQRSDGSIDTLTEAEIDRAFDTPCSELVADRMTPAAAGFAFGILLALVVLIGSAISWWRSAPPKPKRNQTVVDHE